MRPDILHLASDLAERGERFCLATVVRRESPHSSQVGDTALITLDGTFHGWLGGSCTRPTVLKEALDVLAQGTSRLIALVPDPSTVHRKGVTAFPMTCHSGGSVEIFIEAVLPPPRLIVMGTAPATQALVRLAKAIGYTVDAVDPEADQAHFPEADRVMKRADAPELAAKNGARPFAVVATMGQWDEEATLAALSLQPAYLGVVASAKRFEQVRATLFARGATQEAVDRIRNPAGLSIGAVTPEEIALAILAEIVQVRRAEQPERAPSPSVAPAATTARDPICGMDVDVETARYKAEWEGRTYYFCCGGCRERFLGEPARYHAAAQGVPA